MLELQPDGAFHLKGCWNPSLRRHFNRFEASCMLFDNVGTEGGIDCVFPWFVRFMAASKRVMSLVSAYLAVKDVLAILKGRVSRQFCRRRRAACAGQNGDDPEPQHFRAWLSHFSCW